MFNSFTEPTATGKTKKNDDKKDPASGYPDLTQFIRSMQRIEGGLDCFAKTAKDCDSPDCQWHIYHLKELKKGEDKNDQWNSKMV